ncbi:SURF1 family protein [Streptacidiphilus sp. N1-10]|uniref:SURF1-like protein n=1 Tax=Streptacidiphilus jeojiensis TaxID=3229225 RepID=A0ABV6XY03_9ACTN
MPGTICAGTAVAFASEDCAGGLPRIRVEFAVQSSDREGGGFLELYGLAEVALLIRLLAGLLVWPVKRILADVDRDDRCCAQCDQCEELRCQQQTSRSDRIVNANVSAPVVPFASLSHPGATVPATLMYRRVSATGRYDTAHQFVVRSRTDAEDDTGGFYLVTPLITADGDAVLVNRGWVAPNSTHSQAFPTVPPAPAGTVTVVGRLRPDETHTLTGIRNVTGLPARQYMMINSQEQAKNLPDPVLAGYLDLMTTTPPTPAADTAQQVPGPNDDSTSSSDDAVVGKGVHLPYATALSRAPRP